MTLLTKYATNDLQIVHQNISFHQKNKQLVLHEADSRLDGFYTLAEYLRNSTFLPIQTQVKHKTDSFQHTVWVKHPSPQGTTYF